MGVSLSKGGNVSLTKEAPGLTAVSIGLGWDIRTTTGTDFATVDSGDVVGAFTKIDSTSEDSVVQRVCYVGSKRYVRVNLDFTGTGITANITGVYAIVGHGSTQPTAAPTVAAAV